MSGADLPTQSSQVEFSRQRPLAAPLSPDDIDAMCGVGWEGDLDVMRADNTLLAVLSTTAHGSPPATGGIDAAARAWTELDS